MMIWWGWMMITKEELELTSPYLGQPPALKQRYCSFTYASTQSSSSMSRCRGRTAKSCRPPSCSAARDLFRRQDVDSWPIFNFKLCLGCKRKTCHVVKKSNGHTSTNYRTRMWWWLRCDVCWTVRGDDDGSWLDAAMLHHQDGSSTRIDATFIWTKESLYTPQHLI